GWGWVAGGGGEGGGRGGGKGGRVAGDRRGVPAIKGARGGRPAGLTLAMQDLQAVEGGEARRDEERRLSEDVFVEAARGDDFMGVQTYTRRRYGPDGMRGPDPGVPTTQMGYEFWPDALDATIRRAWTMTEHVPLFVTENGIATSEDAERITYVELALRGVLACLRDGIDVR